MSNILNGWAGPKTAEEAYKKFEKHFTPFCLKDDSSKTCEYLWRFTKIINKGNHIPTLTQEIGDCVSFATAQAGNYLTAIQMVEDGDNIKFKPWYPPYIYGVSRTASDCGNGQLGRSDGSVGSWAIEAIRRHGVLFTDDEGVPKYSGSIAKEWGYRGVPQKFYDIASDNPLKAASRIDTVEQLRTALLNKCPVIIGSSQGFNTKVLDNHVIYVPSGTWGHEMVFIGWQDEPFPAAYRQNSWGDNSTPKPLNGEPNGGAWCKLEDLEKEFRRDVEMFALSRFDGFKFDSSYRFL